MPPEKLDAATIEAWLEAHPAWRRVEERLERRFTFPDFRHAFAFMSQVALAAEAAGHHPDWQNVYATVDVRLSTHDIGGLSKKDLDLATVCDEAAGSRRA